MKGFEFFRNVSVGQYIDAGSYTHRLSPATKYLGLLAFFAVIFANRSPLGSILILLAALLAGAAARVKPGFLLRGILPAWPFLAFISLLTLVFQKPSGIVLASLGPFSLSLAPLAAIAQMLLRFAAIVVSVGLFTSVTTEREAAYGVEDALSPLERIGFPAHEFALMIACALRFVPIVAGELEAIAKAQASRGGDFGRSGFNPIKKAQAYLPLFAPLMVRTLERAEALAEAMEARCYAGKGRTRLARFEKAPHEALARLAILVFGAGGIAMGVLMG